MAQNNLEVEMAEAQATLGTMNKLVRRAAGIVVTGAIAWCAYITSTVQAIGADVAVLKTRDGMSTRLSERIERLEQTAAAASAARDQMVAEYRLTIARLEGHVEGQRRDIQNLSTAIATLTAEVKSFTKEKR